MELPSWRANSPAQNGRLDRGGDIGEPPTFDPGLVIRNRKVFFPPLKLVEFSPDGKLLAVIQNRDMHDDDMLELLLIRLPGGEVWKSFPLPYNRWDTLGGIARRLFSDDGRLLAWHEL